MAGTCYEKLIESHNENGVVAFYGRRIKLSGIINDIERFAAALIKCGFARGDTITVYLPTSVQAIVAFYAASKTGITANIVHPLMPLGTLKENIAKTRSKGLLYFDALTPDRSVFDGMNQTLIECSVADYAGVLSPFFRLYSVFKCKGERKAVKYKEFLKQGDSFVPVEGQTEDIAVTMHSGGTDGNPKIVAVSNRALNALSDNLTLCDKIDKHGDYSLVALPVFHAFGLGVSVHTALVKGYNLCLMAKFNARRANAYVGRFNVSMIAGVPVMFKKMSEQKNFKGRKLKKLCSLWCGGDVLTEDAVRNFDKKIAAEGGLARLMRGYGLSEVTGVCAVNTEKNYKAGSVGLPILDTVIEIWDEKGNALKPYEKGEIAVATAACFSGYVEGPDCRKEKDGKVFVLTGDVGYLDDEGYLFVTGRKKRTVKINAVNVFPSEVEDVILKAEGVREVAVTDYSEGNKVYLKAYVVAEKNADCDKIRKEINEISREKLIKYSHIKKVEFVDDLPRTGLGKIDYKKLKE